MPIGLPCMPGATYKADMLGGTGSGCPALLPNSTLVQYQMACFSAVLPHNDGILLVRPTDERGIHQRTCLLYRLLLADSGHYVLPVDRFEDKADRDEQRELREALTKYLDATLFADLRHADKEPRRS